MTFDLFLSTENAADFGLLKPPAISRKPVNIHNERLLNAHVNWSRQQLYSQFSLKVETPLLPHHPESLQRMTADCRLSRLRLLSSSLATLHIPWSNLHSVDCRLPLCLPIPWIFTQKLSSCIHPLIIIKSYLLSSASVMMTDDVKKLGLSASVQFFADHE